MTADTFTPHDHACFVDGGWWGHCATARAVQVARELGWPGADERDARIIDALVLTCMSDGGHLGVSRADANDARKAAWIAPLADGEDTPDDVFEALVLALDDAEAWLTERSPEGWWGHNDGDWGYWPYEDEDGEDI